MYRGRELAIALVALSMVAVSLVGLGPIRAKSGGPNPWQDLQKRLRVLLIDPTARAAVIRLDGNPSTLVQEGDPLTMGLEIERILRDRVICRSPDKPSQRVWIYRSAADRVPRIQVVESPAPPTTLTTAPTEDESLPSTAGGLAKTGAQETQEDEEDP